MAKTIIIGLLTGIFLILNNHGFSQLDSIKGKYMFSSRKITIGEQIKLKIEIELPKTYSVDWHSLKDSLNEKVEILDDFKTDTLKSQNADLIKYNKEFLITSFDSGIYFNRGSYITLTSNKGEKLINLLNGDSLEVINPKIDIAKDFKDIKRLDEEAFSWKEYLMYAYVILGILLLLVIIFFLNRSLKKDKPFKAIFQSKPKPAHIIAFEALKQLDNKKLWQSGEYKMFYSELSDIFRLYIENRYSFPAMESLSGEIINFLIKNTIAEMQHTDIQKVLDLTDAVKFAKMIPLPDENTASFKTIFQFVDTTKQQEENLKKEVGS